MFSKNKIETSKDSPYSHISVPQGPTLRHNGGRLDGARPPGAGQPAGQAGRGPPLQVQQQRSRQHQSKGIEFSNMIVCSSIMSRFPTFLSFFV